MPHQPLLSTDIKENVVSALEQSAFQGFRTCLPISNMDAVVVAVSGGSDSMALLLLAQVYCKANLPECRLYAVTVDHQLRAESAAEATAVAAFCAQNGIAHRTMVWPGVKPSSGVAAAARYARYDLLVEAARDCGATVILTGHTADDQVETYMMRALRDGNGTAGLTGAGRGLAAMAPQTLLQNSVLLCRPVLSLEREKLRDYLRLRQTNWFDDPSNDNLAYERPRIRQAAQLIDRPAILASIADAASRRLEDNRRIARLMAAENGLIRLENSDLLLLADGWDEAEPDLVPLILAYILAVMGGKAFLPSLNDCGALAQWLGESRGSGIERRTLHGCVIEKTPDATHIRRECRNLPVATLEAGQSVLWDGRYHVTNTMRNTVMIAAPKPWQLSEYLKLHALKCSPKQRQILLSSPAVFHDGVLRALPILPDLGGAYAGILMKRSLTCFDKVLSGYDFVVARALKSLLTMPLNHKNS